MDDDNHSKRELEFEEEVEEEAFHNHQNSNSEDFGDEFVGNDDCDEQSRKKVEGNSSIPPKTLAAEASSDLHCSFEVPVEYELQSFDAEQNKDQLGMPEQVDRKHTADQAYPALRKHKQKSSDGPFSVMQLISSTQSPSLPEQGLSPAENRNRSSVPELPKQSPNQLDVVPAQKTPFRDGYNWRKYGQKQVKSPRGSRSYYRCTYSECSAKKIECSDHSNRVIEIVYRNHHNHDPPEKSNLHRGHRVALSIVPVNGSDSSAHPVGTLNDSAPSTSSKDPEIEAPPLMECIEQDSSGSEENPEIDVKQEEPLDEPEPSKRLKKSVSNCSESPPKPGKDHKIVVYAAGDVGISGDGYRWRKYGQKMVKGNPHPRNYYRCTSPGCPVRKHIEMAKDNSDSVIITYKGRHDHGMPVPKRHHGPPSAPLIAATSPASVNALQVTKSETSLDQVSAPQWSADKEGELTGKPLQVGGEKAKESAEL